MWNLKQVDIDYLRPHPPGHPSPHMSQNPLFDCALPDIRRRFHTGSQFVRSDRKPQAGYSDSRMDCTAGSCSRRIAASRLVGRETRRQMKLLTSGFMVDDGRLFLIEAYARRLVFICVNRPIYYHTCSRQTTSHQTQSFASSRGTPSAVQLCGYEHRSRFFIYDSDH